MDWKITEPIVDKEVLVTLEDGEVKIGKYSAAWGWLGERSIPIKVIAWTEKPEGYKYE